MFYKASATSKYFSQIYTDWGGGGREGEREESGALLRQEQGHHETRLALSLLALGHWNSGLALVKQTRLNEVLVCEDSL